MWEIIKIKSKTEWNNNSNTGLKMYNTINNWHFGGSLRSTFLPKTVPSTMSPNNEIRNTLYGRYYWVNKDI